MTASQPGPLGTLGGMAGNRPKKPKEQPKPRPTLGDVDSWLAQIDQVLDEAPGAPRAAH